MLNVNGRLNMRGLKSLVSVEVRVSAQTVPLQKQGELEDVHATAGLTRQLRLGPVHSKSPKVAFTQFANNPYLPI